MAFGDYYNPSDKAVIDGDTILAADINAINLAVDAGFEQVATDMDSLNGPGLSPLQNLSPAADRLPYYTGNSTAALTTFTSQARALLDDTTSAAQRTTLGLGNVNNTSDVNKPISAATQTALNTISSDLATNNTSNKGAGLVGYRGKTLYETFEYMMSYSPMNFGGVGNGTSDDTAALQAAVDAKYSLGGGWVNLSGYRWLVDTANLVVKDGVYLVGTYENVSLNNTITASLIKGALIVNPTYTVLVSGDNAGVKGVAVLRKGLTTPISEEDAATVISNFSGVGITVGLGGGGGGATLAHYCYVGRCLVLGFEYAVYSDYNNRLHIEYVTGDCTNGIYLKRSYDMQHLSHCHFWPVVTAGQAWSINVSARVGYAYIFDTDVDWGQADHCFSYGYKQGFRIIDSQHVELLNCGNDYSSSTDQTDVRGLYAEGDCRGLKIIGHKAAAQEVGYEFALDNGTTTGSATMIGCDGWGNTVADIRVTSGKVLIKGNILHSSASTANIDITSGAGRCIISGNDFYGATLPINIDSAVVNNVMIGQNQGTADSTYGETFICDNAKKQKLTHIVGGASDVAAFTERYRKTSGTLLEPAIVASNTGIYALIASVYDGSNYGDCASIRLATRGTTSAGSTAGGILLSTTSVGSTTPTSRIICNENGNWSNVTDNTGWLGSSSSRWGRGYIKDLRPGDGTPIWTSGSGTPEASVTAPIGSLYTRTDGGANTTLYVKESGTGSTGWVAK